MQTNTNGQSLGNCSLDEIVFRVALAYEKLYRKNPPEPKGLDNSQKSEIMSRTGIGYFQTREGLFLLYIRLAPYTLKVNDEHFLFEGVPIGGQFRIREKSIAFTGPPRVLKPDHYHHPSVYVDNTIDCSTEDRWRNPPLEIRWNDWYNATQQNTIFKIAKWLEEGRIALQDYDSRTRPVHLLNRNNFPSEYRTPKELAGSGVRSIANS